ncbi:hypothetical protein MHYP_G00294720 [Metynnis hypsauchen]
MRLVGTHWQPPTLRNDVCHGGFNYATASGCKKFIGAVISMQPGNMITQKFHIRTNVDMHSDQFLQLKGTKALTVSPMRLWV